MSKFKIAGIVLWSFLLINCAAGPQKTSSRPPQGEQVVFDFDKQIEGWTISKSQAKDHFALLWANPQDSKRDTFQLAVFFGDGQDIDAFRKAEDDPGRSQCDLFTSKQLKQDYVNNYPSKLWATECMRGGKTVVRTINLAVTGDGTLYYFAKVWKYDVGSDTYKIWLDGFYDKVTVCDTRSLLHECPVK